MRIRTNEVDGHNVSVHYDKKNNLFLKVDGVFYQILLDEYGTRLIETDEPCTPEDVTELPKEYQPQFIGYDRGIRTDGGENHG